MKTAPWDSGSSPRRCPMISDRRPLSLSLSLASACVALVAAGCGDYSNEDLEFMNALPESSELRANIPPRSSALAPADEAELARSTHTVTAGFNGLLGALVDIVDTGRSYPPTTPTPNGRIWGPFPADRPTMKNPP